MANAASYCYDLSGSQKLYLSNQGMLTTVTSYVGSAGQQQQSSQGVATGQWKALPQLYQLGGGYIAIIFADQTFYLSIQGTQMQVSAGASGDGIAQQISQLEPLPAQPTEPSSTPAMKPMTPMAPMTPMQPMTMTMGDMSMSMGEMRMGDMSMSAQSTASQSEAASQKKFCSHCGAAVGVRDRFCSQCGNQLTK
ncbi:MAG: zinc ribbon domain-containing protein [Cyanobacteria bacterium P01_D01_bin.1]